MSLWAQPEEESSEADILGVSQHGFIVFFAHLDAARQSLATFPLMSNRVQKVGERA